MRKQFLIVTLFVLVLRLSFLYQAIQGDDLYYLYGAEHAQVDPLSHLKRKATESPRDAAACIGRLNIIGQERLRQLVGATTG